MQLPCYLEQSVDIVLSAPAKLYAFFPKNADIRAADADAVGIRGESALAASLEADGWEVHAIDEFLARSPNLEHVDKQFGAILSKQVLSLLAFYTYKRTNTDA